MLKKTDALPFDPDELVVNAEDDNLDRVQAFVEEHLARVQCSLRTKMQLAIAVEELFINIAHYAYTPKKGMAKVRVSLSKDPPSITITFYDRGKPYDPLARADPDVTLSAEDRKIGGLGIYMVKQSMDEMSYAYQDGQNILSITKKL